MAGLDATRLAYVPEGGSYHWTRTDGAACFINVDDLGQKPWISHDGNEAYAGLRTALATAAVLRHRSRLPFVIAPVAAGDGEPLRRITGQYML